MSKMLTAVVCGCLIVALAIPAYAGGGLVRSTVSQVGGTVYTGEEQLLYGTGVLVDGCLNNIFSIFNTCLDFVLGCTTTVLSPLDKGFAYAESAVYKQMPRKKAAKAPKARKAAPQK